MGACTVSVLVVDNDPAGIVAELVTRTAPTHIPVRYVIEKELGIAAARQRVLDESSGADLLQFVDDDEVPDPHWLRRMVAAWIDFAGPTAVAGVVRPDYQGRPERRCMGRPARQFPLWQRVAHLEQRPRPVGGVRAGCRAGISAPEPVRCCACRRVEESGSIC